MTKSRKYGLCVVLWLAALAPAADAQVPDMGDNGMTLPAFFFSRGEQMAREACEQRSPNCRPAVREQMELERNISLLLPWAAGVAGLVVALFYMRRREQEKEAKRRLAQRRHVPGAYKSLDKDKREEEAKAQRQREEEDDRFR